MVTQKKELAAPAAPQALRGTQECGASAHPDAPAEEGKRPMKNGRRGRIGRDSSCLIDEKF